MSNFDANSLLSDPAPLWFDGPLAADALLADALAATDPGRPALAVVPAAPADPLALALPWLVRHLGVAAAVEAVVGPVDDERPAASAAVLPALRRIGFDAHLQRRSLASFSRADLPTILMLHSGDACVLTERWQDQQGQAWCNVVLPGPQPDEFSSAEAEIESAYSGMALVVSPPRPPFASALARARLAAAELPERPAVPAAAPADGHADALVALAAAMQTAQRAMQASRTGPAAAVPAALSAAVPVAVPAAAAQRPGGTATPHLARALSGRAAAPAMLPAGPADAARTAEPAGYGPPVADADDRAAVLQLRFMQTGPVASTPRQALALLASAAGQGLRQACGGLRRGLAGAVRATLARLRQCGRCLGKPLGLGLQGLRRAARWIQAGRHRLLNSGLPRRFLTRLQRARRQALGLRLHWLRRRRHRQAMQALGPAARPLPQPGLPDMAAAQALPAAPHRGLVPKAGWAGPARPARAVPAGPVALAMRSGLAVSAMRSGLAAGAAGSGLAIGWALCLLVGAPLAWAPLVSDGSLLAMRAAPRLLRDAFAVDLDRAAAALAAPAQAPLAAGPRRLERPAQALPADSGRVEPRLGAETGRSADARAPAAGQGGARLRPAPLRPALRGRSVPRRARYAGR